jgi:hypothetical protein
MEEILTHFQAYCDLHTRSLEPNIPIPPSLQPAPHMGINDPHKFITTALTRLESDSPRIRGISERVLRAYINYTQQ